MSRAPREWVELRWWDAALVMALVAALVMAGWGKRYAPDSSCGAACQADPGCGYGPGPCGCTPTYPPCDAPCSGCCPGGCKPPPPNPTSGQ